LTLKSALLPDLLNDGVDLAGYHYDSARDAIVMRIELRGSCLRKTAHDPSALRRIGNAMDAAQVMAVQILRARMGVRT
jgi:hypothetical protein